MKLPEKLPMRPILAAAIIALPTLAPAQDAAPCNVTDLCLQDQFLRVQIEDVRIRDTYANVGITFTNLDLGPVDLSVYSIYLIAISAAGERIELSTNRRHYFIGQDATRKDAHSLKFDSPVGSELDLIFIFENPDSSYAFLGLQDTGAPALTN